MLLTLLCTWLALSPKGRTLWIAQEDQPRIVRFELSHDAPAGTIRLSFVPRGLVAGPTSLYVADETGVRVVQFTGQSQAPLATGRGATSPVLSRDSRFLYVCNRFDNTVSIIDVKRWRVRATVRTCREPIAAALTSDGKQLFVACHLPDQPLTAERVAAKVSVIDTAGATVERSISLPNGSSGVRGIALSADGLYAFVTHLLARYTLPTTQLEQGWMSTNALTILDVPSQRVLATVSLDDVDDGAANPWAVACTPDSRYVCVTHAGTDELSVIRLPELLDKLRHSVAEPSNELSYLLGLRQRVALPGKGPRALAISGSDVWIGEHFSGTLDKVRLDGYSEVATIALDATSLMTDAQRGEMLFNDASFCFQRWQSCASCHPDGRADGLNWDLLNDGIGSPKNVKSLVYSYRNAPLTWTGVTPTYEDAIRGGVRHILFSEPQESQVVAIEAYLRALRPVPGSGEPDAVDRGRKLFFRADVGCAKCHPPPLYTDNRKHDVGTHGAFDFTSDAAGKRVPQTEFETPTLVEVWRTAPYLHDGRFATLEETISTGNHRDLHGRTSHLTREQLRDLAAFVASL